MCTLDYDKLLVGQSDEYIRLYQISQAGGGTDLGGRHPDELASLSPALPSPTPLAAYKFEDSGINNLCSLN